MKFIVIGIIIGLLFGGLIGVFYSSHQPECQYYDVAVEKCQETCLVGLFPEFCDDFCDDFEVNWTNFLPPQNQTEE